LYRFIIEGNIDMMIPNHLWDIRNLESGTAQGFYPGRSIYLLPRLPRKGSVLQGLFVKHPFNKF
jgi:hypothetical protein